MFVQWCLTVIPSDGIFDSHRTTITESSSCILAFKLEYALFYEFYAKIYQCAVKECGSAPLNDVDVNTCDRQWRQNDFKTSKIHPDVIRESPLTSSRVKRHFLAPPPTCPRVSHTDGARCPIFGRTLRLPPYFMCANSEGSGETALVAYVISTIISWAGSNDALDVNVSRLYDDVTYYAISATNIRSTAAANGFLYSPISSCFHSWFSH